MSGQPLIIDLLKLHRSAKNNKLVMTEPCPKSGSPECAPLVASFKDGSKNSIRNNAFFFIV